MLGLLLWIGGFVGYFMSLLFCSGLIDFEIGLVVWLMVGLCLIVCLL